MELQDFVEETLFQIAHGVHSAQSRIGQVGGVVNPRMHILRNDQTIGQAMNRPHDRVSLIEFDVAVSATTKSGTKGGVGVVAGIVNLGTAGESAKESGTVSRVKFSVPFLLPCQLA